jgi:hypothetical protein
LALNELERRKPTFDEANSVGVTLGDGQKWFVPKPWLEIRPTFRGGRATGNYPVNTYGHEIDALVDVIAGAEDSLERLSGIASLAAYLLTQQYELEDADLDKLLCFRLNDESSTDWTGQVIKVATGRSGPKRLRAGGD